MLISGNAYKGIILYWPSFKEGGVNFYSAFTIP